ncbi:Sec-independent protein translocase protein TatB [Streptomyces sp. NPDC057582]|uniref:Sec-independent protein translocase protein TatB n=1 Tax=Streptomyces sp. NPDC057582 TaxID=3346174 RepID=UPI003692A7FF
MFFDMGPLEILAIFVIAIIVLGPEKLPKAVSDISAVLRKVRSFADSAQAEIRKELGPEFSDLHIGDLNPRALAERALRQADEEAGLYEFKSAFSFDEPGTDDVVSRPMRQSAQPGGRRTSSPDVPGCQVIEQPGT